MNKKSEFVRNQLQYLLLQLEVNQLNSLLEFSSEILLFFAKYSFLFENSSDSINSCTADTSQFLMPQAFRERPVIFIDPNGLTTLDDFNYQKRTEDTDKSIENQQRYNMKEYEYALGNQGLTEFGNMNYIYQKYNCQFYDDKNYLGRLNDDLSLVPEQYRKKAKNQRYNEAYDFLFSCIMQSLVGIPYNDIDASISLEALDCSGSIIYCLRELGFSVKRENTKSMTSGVVQWISLMNSTNEKLAGNQGMLNFYKTGTSKRINHVNVGIGEIGIPKVFAPQFLGKKQIIDATEGDSMLCRNDGRLYLGQYNNVGAKQINQTYAPFSSKTHPMIQGKINWSVLRDNRF